MPLRHEVMRDRDGRIDRPGAAGGADADAAHRFDAAADRHVLLSRHDLRGGEIDRIETGGAEAVDLHAGHAVAVAGHQRRGARDVGAGFADRIDDAHDHVVDQSGIELVAVLDGAERLAGEIERGHFVKRAIHLAATAGCAHVIVNKGVGHWRLLTLMTLSRCRRRRPRGMAAKPDWWSVGPDPSYSPSSAELQRVAKKPPPATPSSRRRRL